MIDGTALKGVVIDLLRQGEKYSEDQERDEGGKWTVGGGGAPERSETVEAVRTWTQSEVATTDIRKAADKVLDGKPVRTDDQRTALTLMQAVQNNGKAYDDVYRGLSFKNEAAQQEFINDLGAQFDMSLAAASTDESVARDFADMHPETETEYGVILHMQDTAGLPAGQYYKGPEPESEVIVSGRFTVGSTEVDGDNERITHVELTHTEDFLLPVDSLQQGAKYSEDQERDENGRFSNGGGDAHAGERGSYVPSYGGVWLPYEAQFDLKDVALEYQSSYGATDAMQAGAEAVLRGERAPSDEFGSGAEYDKALILLDAIAEAPLQEEELYRGLHFDSEEERQGFIDGLGSETSIALASTSPEYDLAEQFATTIMLGDFNTQNVEYPLMVVIAPGSPGIAVNPIIGAEPDYPNETIVSGRYDVSDIAVPDPDANSGMITVTLTPAARWEIPLSAYKAMAGYKYSDDQSRDESGRWTNGGGDTSVAGSLQEQLQREGGFTYSLQMRGCPTSGKVLSLHRDREMTFTNNVTPDDINAYVAKNADLLTDEGNYVGGWRDTETGTVYLDVSTIVQTDQEAQDLGAQHGQLAYYDIASGSEVRMGEPVGAKAATRMVMALLPKQPTADEVKQFVAFLNG